MPRWRSRLRSYLTHGGRVGPQHPDFRRVTDDKFFISVEAKDPKFDRQGTRELLAKLGFQQIEEVAP